MVFWGPRGQGGAEDEGISWKGRGGGVRWAELPLGGPLEERGGGDMENNAVK